MPGRSRASRVRSRPDTELKSGRIQVAGTWWRQVRAGIGPLDWIEPPPDARWQRGSEVGALYLADSPETAWAEFYRALSEYGVPPSRAMPRRLAEIAIDLGEIEDLVGEGALEEHKLPRPAPSSSAWLQFQLVGERLFNEGASGLVAPSAARKGGRVLCLFRPQLEIEGVEVTEVVEVSQLPRLPHGLRT